MQSQPPCTRAQAIRLEIDKNANAVALIPIASVILVIVVVVILMMTVPITLIVMPEVVIAERWAGGCQHKSYGESRNGEESTMILF